MKIRSKLLLSFGSMLAVVLAAGIVSVWAAVRWRQAAGEFSLMRNQSQRAERLRVDMYRLVTYGLDQLSGTADSPETYRQLRLRVQQHLDELKRHARTETELDHIEGLSQTEYELEWTMQRIFRSMHDTAARFDPVSARSRLREIADEVTDDLAVLSQYYQAKVDDRVAEASRAGTLAMYVIQAAVIIALGQLLAVLYLSRRWLMHPIETVNRTLHRVSRGDLTARISIQSHDEWETLAAAVNEMAGSLERLQQQVRSQERMAALGEVVAYAAHNIRNPLAGIRAATQVLLSDIGPSQSDTREVLEEIIATVDRMEVWMNGLLNLARPMQLDRRPTRPADLVEGVLTEVAGRCRDSRIQWRTELAPELPVVMLDPALMEQALAAVVTNAFESGGDQVTLKVDHAADSPEQLVITVQDNGRGISERVRDKLFRAFVTDKPHGTGLGLAQARKIIELHEGSIELQSAPGRGTTVTIKLPLILAPEHADSASDRREQEKKQ